MAREPRKPNYKTKFGIALKTIMNDHPILYSIWDEKIKSLYNRIPDKVVIELIMDDWDKLANIKYKTVVLPYSTELHLKLKKLVNEKVK